MGNKISGSQQTKYILSIITPPLLDKLTRSIGRHHARKRLHRCARQLYRNYYLKAARNPPECYSLMPAEELFIQLTFYQLQALL
ncbi:hypothetical protein HNQ91_000678 [Filimonas zeae]|uniref:hypothetical protein n=1 Tax=Filimonas zeae TaxID=1737353 RepID=UPI001663A5C3|nr:hypothetical protein [Filimonas zeae]MDR6337656.1 hypothetical protein [Filimonas zeae]